MRWPRRRDHDYDWQRELSARAPDSLTINADDEPDARSSSGRRLVEIALGLTVLFASFGVAIKIFDPHPSIVLRAIGLASSAVLFLSAVANSSKRFKRWSKGLDVAEYNDVKARSILNVVWADSNGFLKRPPERQVYERWLSSNRRWMAALSPAMASEWSQSDVAFDRAAQTVSSEELESRRQRILTMYRLVQQGAYGEPAVDPHALRSGGLDRSVVE
jgi:hypothetical protein